MPPAVAVKGLADLQRALAKADRDIRLGVRKELRQIAEPIRSQAESLASREIPRIGKKWPKMRTGVSRNLIYVAPRQRGVKTKGGGSLARPNLGTLLMGQAMEPALDQHRSQAVHDVERMLDRVCDRFNHGGPL